MATVKPELKTILDKYGINPRDTSQVWDCRGTLVLYHKAFEIIGAKEAIRFDPPQMIRTERDEAVVLVVGHMGERAEWSFGEAAPANCKNTYPYAMAEKRAKDRVIAKLVGLSAYIHSEDEAEEFKSGERKAAEVADNGSGEAPKTEPKHAAPKPTAGKFDLLDPNGTKLGTYEKPDDWCDALRLTLTNFSDQGAAIWSVNKATAEVIRAHYTIAKWRIKGVEYHPCDVLQRMSERKAA